MLIIPGTLHGERLSIIRGTDEIAVQLTPASALLELIRDRFKRKEGYAYHLDFETSNGDVPALRMAILRPRKTFGSGFIETHRKCYRIAILPEQIFVDDAVFELPSDIINPRVLDGLRFAVDQWNNRNCSNDHKNSRGVIASVQLSMS